MACRFRWIQAGLFTALACVFGFAVGTGQAGNPQPHIIGTKRKAPGILNFGEVTPQLYRGGRPTAKGLATLKKLGVDIVVDLRHSPNVKEEAQVTKLGMKYVDVPTWCPFPGDKPYAEFLKVIRENPGKKIFVHCTLGDDRTGMAIAAYRMAEEGWTAEDAMKEMQAFGYTAIHHAMCPGLAGYERSFPERLKKNPALRGLTPQKDGTNK